MRPFTFREPLRYTHTHCCCVKTSVTSRRCGMNAPGRLDARRAHSTSIHPSVLRCPSNQQRGSSGAQCGIVFIDCRVFLFVFRLCSGWRRRRRHARIRVLVHVASLQPIRSVAVRQLRLQRWNRRTPHEVNPSKRRTKMKLSRFDPSGDNQPPPKQTSCITPSSIHPIIVFQQQQQKANVFYRVKKKTLKEQR